MEFTVFHMLNSLKLSILIYFTLLRPTNLISIMPYVCTLTLCEQVSLVLRLLASIRVARTLGTRLKPFLN